jgi:hypothetical protein
MKNTRSFLFLFLLFITVSPANAKGSDDGRTKRYASVKEFVKKSPWSIHLGYVVTEDDGSPLKGVLNIAKSWNYNFLPTKLGLETKISDDWTVYGGFTYNSEKSGKLLNNEFANTKHHLWAIDFAAKWRLRSFFNINSTWFDPYCSPGIGYTHKSYTVFNNSCTLNVALGVNFWIQEDMMAICVQSESKFGLHPPFFSNSSNYMQHSISFVYRIDQLGKIYKKEMRKLKIKIMKARDKATTFKGKL